MSKLVSLEIALPDAKFDDRTRKPVLTKWRGVEMIRHHSLLATIRDILAVKEDLDVVKIGIIGEESTGKTTLAETLAHLIHTMSKVPFAVRVFGEKEFLDFEATLASLDPANYILIFDDVSFINDRKAIENLKNRITKIRHLPGGQDVQIVLIYNYHYSLGLDKYLRQSRFKYYTSYGSSEKDNLINMFGSKYTSFVDDFQTKYNEMTRKHTTSFEIKTGRYFIYKRKNPFINCVFYDGQKPRWTLFPKREWLQPVCSKCSAARHALIKSEIDIPTFAKESETKWGKGTFQSCIKLKLLQNGINVYKPKMKSCMKYFDMALSTKLITPEDLATHYGFESKLARLREKLDGILAT